ncbi:hypothetical protein [Streptomyces sp. NPDC020742]|uniref:hypothetical protein n=1 Tax=Streptomyces sp. NPDC020742 TaxID=3154897 RepID=UPI0033C3FA9E
MIADTYGMDRSAEELAYQRAATDLGRTLAAFDEGVPVAGASLYSRGLRLVRPPAPALHQAAHAGCSGAVGR